MKKLFLAIVAVLLIQSATLAAGIGYVNYDKVVKGYPLAQKYQKELKTKAGDLEKYIKNQDALIKKAKTQEEALKIRKNAMAEVNKRQKAYTSTKIKYEADIVKQIKVASEAIRASKKLDAVVKEETIITGGVDITADVIKKLKTPTTKSKSKK